MPGNPGGQGFSVDVETLVDYAGWLEGASAVVTEMQVLLGKWCKPPAYAYGVDLPLIGDTAQKLHLFAEAAVDARGDDLAGLATVLHQMAMGLAQVVANYTSSDVRVVANFGGPAVVRETILPSLPSTYDVEIEPHR